MRKWLKQQLLKRMVNTYKSRGLNEFETLVTLAQDIMPSYKFRWPEMDWLEQKEFWAFIERHDDRRGVNADRKWALAQLFRLCIDLPGDTAECGVYSGASSLLICEAIQRRGSTDKTHHLFDSFEGVSEPGAVDGTYWTKGSLACPEEKALATLEPFRNFIRSYPGWIPERFAEVAESKFCFVHIDVDLHDPTRDSLEFFYPRVVPGGIILCDDYGFTTCPGATRAFDSFLEGRPESTIALPGGGGFLIKDRITAVPGPYLDLGSSVS